MIRLSAAAFAVGVHEQHGGAGLSEASFSFFSRLAGTLILQQMCRTTSAARPPLFNGGEEAVHMPLRWQADG